MNGYSQFESTLNRLKNAIDQPKDEFIRDSVIQRFKFTCVASWITAKRCLGLSSSAPKVIVREMAQQGVITSPEYWFKLIDVRNESSYSYKEEVAEKIYAIAIEAVSEFERLLEKLKIYGK